MQFLYPAFLFALAALAIPVIIHLFNFRRFKKIPFTNVRFLKEIKHQTQSQNRLKHLLILLMRLLAVAFLVFAFAQPIIPEDKELAAETGKTVSVFIDNSFSMEGESESGVMLEVAKNRALDIAEAYAATDRFQLLTQDFEGKHQRLVGKSEFIDLVQNIGVSPQSRSLQEIADRQSDLLKSDGSDHGKESYIISDFQKSRYDLDNLQVDTNATLSLVYLQRNSPANLYIDSVWFSTPVRKIDDSEKLHVRIANTGNEAVEDVPIKLTINGTQGAIGSFGAPANSVRDTVLYIIHEGPGIKRLTVSIDDFPVTYDDTYYLAYNVFKEIRTLSIRPNNAGHDPYISSVFRGDSSFVYETTSVNSVNYAQLVNYDLIILYELDHISSGLATELSAFLKNGGSVWLIPSENPNMDEYNSFLAEIKAGGIIGESKGNFEVRKLNIEHPLYTGIFDKLPRNIDLPKAQKYFKYSRSLSSKADDLMTLGNGDIFLTSYAVGQGNFYALAAPLSDPGNTFSRHAMFVATTLRLGEMSRATAVNAIHVGNHFTLPGIPMGTESVFHLIGIDGRVDVIPQHTIREGRVEINPGPDITEAGNYDIILGDDTLAAVGLNYPRSESNLASFTRDEIQDIVKNIPGNPIRIYDGNSAQLSRNIEKSSKGTELWKICLILVLVFLLAESILLRFWKTQKARVTDAERGINTQPTL